MNADEIRDGLGTRFMGRQILYYDEIDSTNDTVFKLGEEGLDEGLCVFAEYQRKGKGRLGRTWLSPKGKGVLFSLLLRPLLPPTEISKITLTAAVSVVKTIEKVTGRRPGIKWPNDVLFGDKKVCGILTEMSAEADRVKFVVVGIGVNVNAGPEELPPGAASLQMIAGSPVSRVEFTQELLRQLEKDCAGAPAGRPYDEEWERYSLTTGKRVSATLFGRKIQGQAVGIDAAGALWIRSDNGLQERIMAGDVEHLR